MEGLVRTGMNKTSSTNKRFVKLPDSTHFFCWIYKEHLDVQGFLLSIVEQLPRFFHLTVCKILKKLATALDRIEGRLGKNEC